MVNYSIDLGGIVTIIVVIGGFVFSIIRRNVEVGSLQRTVDTLTAAVGTLQITVARLEERITNMALHRDAN